MNKTRMNKITQMMEACLFGDEAFYDEYITRMVKERVNVLEANIKIRRLVMFNPKRALEACLFGDEAFYDEYISRTVKERVNLLEGNIKIMQLI
jgi:hypothetical protein